MTQTPTSSKYSARMSWFNMDKYEEELRVWLDANTAWGFTVGTSNYIIRFATGAELTMFLLRWSDICD